MKHLATGLPSDPRRDLGFTPTAIRFGLLGASVFFLGTLAIYLIARTGQIDAHVTSAQGLERIRMPIWFWFSTLMILVSSVSLWGTKKFVENRDPRLARRAVVAAAALGWAFLLLQVPGIRALFREHALMADQRVFVYAVMAILFGLHAAHVLGGIVPLTAVAWSTRTRPLSSERLPVVRYLGWYWHYLALVWIVIFNVLLLVG